jgi:hypothetical protein
MAWINGLDNGLDNGVDNGVSNYGGSGLIGSIERPG